ncbi:MAG: hypothetical protein ACOYK8_06420 [Alphaproteobacteria bacterium]
MFSRKKNLVSMRRRRYFLVSTLAAVTVFAIVSGKQVAAQVDNEPPPAVPQDMFAGDKIEAFQLAYKVDGSRSNPPSSYCAEYDFYQVRYTADEKITETYPVRVCHKPGVTRVEYRNPGNSMVLITDRAKQVTQVVLAHNKTYVDTPIATNDIGLPFSFGQEMVAVYATSEESKPKNLGKEKINGIEATHYQDTKAERTDNQVWVTDDDIVVKKMYNSVPLYQITKLDRSPPDEKEFMPPADYVKATAIVADPRGIAQVMLSSKPILLTPYDSKGRWIEVTGNHD